MEQEPVEQESQSNLITKLASEPEPETEQESEQESEQEPEQKLAREQLTSPLDRISIVFSLDSMANQAEGLSGHILRLLTTSGFGHRL